MRGLHHTGLIVGEKSTALLVSPASAFVIECQCTQGCSPAYFLAGSSWVDDVDSATIFRNYDAAELGLTEARKVLYGCLAEKGVTFDIKPLSGFVSK